MDNAIIEFRTLHDIQCMQHEPTVIANFDPEICQGNFFIIQEK